MRQRMAQPDAIARYNRRIATVEPAFSSIEDQMGFRRATSRHPVTVEAEMLLNILAHNALRLARAARLFCVCYVESEF